MTDLSIQPTTHQAIYRRWRAQTFAQVVGQEPVVATLRNAVRTNRVAHAILFVGPRGTGKTSLARILAKALNCTDLGDGDPCDACPSCVSIRDGRAMDLVEIDAASNRGIDAIRDLRERINYAPTDLRRKVYILDEAHQITKDAWNALLKSLEEPPDFVVFMFASTHPQEFPPAILSRLQRFDVRRLTTDEIEGKLRRILEADGRSASPEAVRLIARQAAGGMRDAESMLDQLLSSSAEGLDEARVRDLLGLAPTETVAGFVDALVSGHALAGIQLLDQLEDRGRDLRAFLDQVIEAIRGGIVGTDAPPGRAAGPSGHPLTSLAAAARRLAAIDPSRAGVGGLRLQLELALFPDPSMSPGFAPARMPPVEAPRGPEAAASSTVHRPAARTSAPAPGVSTPAASTASAADTGSTETPLGYFETPVPEADAPTPDAPPAAPPARAATGRRSTSRDASADGAPGPAGETAAGRQPAIDASAAGAPTERPGDAPAELPVATPSADRPAEAPVERPASGSAAVVTAPATGDLAVLRDRWPEVVTRVSASPPVKPLIVECRPVGVEDNTVTLGFPESKAFLKDLLEKRRPILEEHISAVLGRPVAVRCVATNIDVVPDLPTDDEAAWVLAEARRIFGEEGADPAEVG